MSKLERQGFPNFPNLSTVATPAKATHTREPDTPEGLNTAQSGPSILSTVNRTKATKRHEKEAQEKKAQEEHEAQEKKDCRERKEREEQERKEQEERAEKERVEGEAREQAEHGAGEQAEREAKECGERGAEKAQELAKRGAKERTEKAARERMERAVRRRAKKEAAERGAEEAQKLAERRAKERTEKAARERTERAVRRRAQKEAAEREAKKSVKGAAEREAKKNAEAHRAKSEKGARRKAAKEAGKQAFREAMEKVKREAKEEKEKEGVEREKKERIEREEKGKAEREGRERIEREAKEKEDREAKEGEEEEKKLPASKTPSTWDSTVGKNDCPRKASGPSQREQKNERASSWDFSSPEKEDKPSGFPPIITSSVPGSIFDGAGSFDFFATGEDDPPGGAEVELCTPLTKKGKGIENLSDLSKAATLTEPVDLGRPDILEDLNMNMSTRVSVSVSSENGCFTDAERGSYPTEPKDVKEDIPMTPKPWPVPSLTPAPAPAEIEPEKPLSLWERNKRWAMTQPAPASSLSSDGNAMNSSGGLGEAGGGGSNTESIAMPTLVGDRQSISTDTARDQKRENQQENIVEGSLGSNPARRRSDLAQPQMTTRPVTKPALAPAHPPQRPIGWGSWGSSLLNSIANTVEIERSPSPESPSVGPKIKGFAPNLPPKSQPVGFGSVNKPTWGTGGAGDNTWGAAKTGPTPIAQKTSTGPAWGARPVGSTFNTSITEKKGEAGDAQEKVPEA